MIEIILLNLNKREKLIKRDRVFGGLISAGG
jgi:hypothetical protein